MKADVSHPAILFSWRGRVYTVSIILSPRRITRSSKENGRVRQRILTGGGEAGRAPTPNQLGSRLMYCLRCASGVHFAFLRARRGCQYGFLVLEPSHTA